MLFHFSPPLFPFSNIQISLLVFIDFVSLIGVYIYTKVVVVVIWNDTISWCGISVLVEHYCLL